jgi:hypothetical protein
MARDCTRRRILPDDLMTEIAVRKPKNASELAGIGRISRFLGMPELDSFSEAIGAAYGMPENEWPSLKRRQLTQEQSTMLTAVLGMLRKKASELRISQGMLCNRRDAEKLVLGGRYLPARRLIEAGVAVAVATDFNPGSSPSLHLPLAMTLACVTQAMTPEEVLRGATSVAARAVGLEGRAGSLAPGSQADLAVIDAPGLNHWLYHFRPNACTAVMKSGRWRIGPGRATG